MMGVMLSVFMITANPFVDSSRIIVRFADSHEIDSISMVSAIKSLDNELTIEKVRTKPFHYVVVRTKSKDYRGIYSRLMGIKGVRYVAPTTYYHASHIPNDPFWNLQWGLPFIHTPAAWDSTTGSTDIKVAIVDQGVQYTHPDLDGHFGTVKGYDFVDDDNDPLPSDVTEDHGTHVAGIIAAEMDNNMGIAGVAQVSLYSLRVLDREGSGTVDNISDGITWAVDHGARVINMSLGGPSGHYLLDEACQYAANHGVITFAASGNDAADSVDYPARYPTVVAVGAIDIDSSVAGYSNYGHEVELTAPGTNIYSTIPYSDYGYMSGTSMATPMASGVAALVISENPALNGAAVRAILDSTAMDMGTPGRDIYYGYGVVDALAAVNAAASYPSIDTLANDNGSPYYYCANEWGPYIKAARYSVSRSAQLQSIIAYFGTPIGFEPYAQTGHYFVWSDNSGIPGSLLAYGDFQIPAVAVGTDQWITIDLTSQGITLNGTFWIGVSQETSHAPYLRQDNVSNPLDNAYSSDGGSSWSYDTDGNYFIRAIITQRSAVNEDVEHGMEGVVIVGSDLKIGSDMLEFEVKSPEVNRIRLIDVAGRTIREKEIRQPGRFSMSLNGMRSGVYFLTAFHDGRLMEAHRVVIGR